MTLPLVAAPQAAASAARPVRAAVAGAAGTAGAFDAVLVKSAEPNASIAASHDVSIADVVDRVAVEEHEWLPDPGADVWTAAWFTGAARATEHLEPFEEIAATALSDGEAAPTIGEAAALVDEAASTLENLAFDAKPGIAPAVPSSVGTPDAGASGKTEMTAAEPPASAPSDVRSAPPDTANAGDVEVAASMSLTTPTAPELMPEREPGATVPRIADDSQIAVGDRGRFAGGQAPQAAAQATKARHPEDPARAAARSALSDAVASRLAGESTGPAAGRENVPAPIATPALVPATDRAQITQTGRAAQSLTAAKSASPEGAELLTHPTELPPAAAPDSRQGAERRGQREDQTQSAWGRAAASDRIVSVPASMVFPGQIGFAAALEHAAPLAGANPATAPHVPATVGPQIVRAVHMQVAQGGGEMILTLSPEHLGTVTLEVKVEQQRVIATLTADTPAVRGWVAAHEHDLAAGLADLGLELDELVVKDDDRRRDDPRDRPTPERRRQSRPDENADFEIAL